MAEEQTKGNSEVEVLDDAASAAELGLEEQLASTPSSDDESIDFFNALDAQVSGDGIAKEPQMVTQEKTTEQTTSLNENPEQSNSLEKEVKTLEKRYADSSREGKRLNSRLSELEPYVPILEAMREDPNLITHVRNYFEGGGSAPTNMKEQMGLSEDFMMDVDDALSNPDGDSGKLFNATIDGIVSKRLRDFQTSQAQSSAKLAEESNFKARHGMNDDEFGEMMDFAKDHTLSLDDIHYLKNREQHQKNVANSTREDMLNQMKTVSGRPSSVASAGSTPPPPDKSVDDVVFDKLMGAESAIEQVM
tara:strand:- start:2566 stop:3480 length:915 start_codon:yes stop_codon:yes gene_type:complete